MKIKKAVLYFKQEKVNINVEIELQNKNIFEDLHLAVMRYGKDMTLESIYFREEEIIE